MFMERRHSCLRPEPRERLTYTHLTKLNSNIINEENIMFFNPDEYYIEKEGGNLPHRHQNGKIQYVTFRLGDSLPSIMLDDIKRWINLFTHINPKPWNRETLRLYHSTITPRVQQMLDQGHGSCVLKNKKLRDIVSSTIFFKDEIEYLVWAFVIMPNHVHLLIQPYAERELEDIMRTIKAYSAYKINKGIGCKGQLWARESFDRLVRSEEHYKHCLHYIQNNPRYLPPDEYTLYIR